MDGIQEPSCDCQIGVVLGNKVNEDGSLSERLEKRLEKAIELYDNQKIKLIIVSGGLGKEGYFEGDKMKEYLLSKGVKNNDIIVDNEGFNTRHTVKNIINLQKSLHFECVIVISQYFHITRTKMLFKKSGIQQVCGASPIYFEWRDFYSVFREFFGFYQQII
jgi:vancomycin permeability regulator SanA